VFANLVVILIIRWHFDLAQSCKPKSFRASLAQHRILDQLYRQFEREYETVWRHHIEAHEMDVVNANSYIQLLRERVFDAILSSHDHTYGELSIERCSRCQKPTHGDVRYLRLACFYAMHEYQIIGLRYQPSERQYVIGVCKGCRHEWLTSLRDWFNTPRDPTIDTDGIRAVAAGTPEYDKFVAQWKAAATRTPQV
jgi:hypothetical protein